jgi:hypothetical protein
MRLFSPLSFLRSLAGLVLFLCFPWNAFAFHGSSEERLQPIFRFVTDGVCKQIEFSPDGRYLFAVCHECLQRLDMASGKLEKWPSGGDLIAVSDDLVAVASVNIKEASVVILDSKSGRGRRAFSVPRDGKLWTTSIRFNGHGRAALVLVSVDGKHLTRVDTWDLESLTRTGRMETNNGGLDSSLSADSSKLAVSTGTGIDIFHVASGLRLKSIETNEPFLFQPLASAPEPDRYLAMPKFTADELIVVARNQWECLSVIELQSAMSVSRLVVMPSRVGLLEKGRLPERELEMLSHGDFRINYYSLCWSSRIVAISGWHTFDLGDDDKHSITSATMILT